MEITVGVLLLFGGAFLVVVAVVLVGFGVMGADAPGRKPIYWPAGLVGLVAVISFCVGIYLLRSIS